MTTTKTATTGKLSRLRVAAVQVVSTADVAGNLAQATELTEEAVASGARLVVLPENYGFLGVEAEATLPWAHAIHKHPFVAPLAAVALARKVWVLCGSVPEVGPTPHRAYNTSVLVSPEGEVTAVYRKIHLFDIDATEAAFCESRTMEAGDKVVQADVGPWRLGLSICYDVRFSELYRTHAKAGAHILAVPAAFTLHTGKDHWEALLRARAIETQCYVIAAAQTGRHHPGRSSWGKSMIVDPWGTVLACAPEMPAAIVADCDADYQARVRRQLPCLQHRRLP